MPTHWQDWLDAVGLVELQRCIQQQYLCNFDSREVHFSYLNANLCLQISDCFFLELAKA